MTGGKRAEGIQRRQWNGWYEYPAHSQSGMLCGGVVAESPVEGPGLGEGGEG